MEPNDKTKLQLFAQQQKSLKARIRMLEEENQALKERIREMSGQISEAMKRQNDEDAQVFRMVRGEVCVSDGCSRIVLEVGR